MLLRAQIIVLILAAAAVAEAPWLTYREPSAGEPEIVIQYHRHNQLDLAPLRDLIIHSRERFFTLADTVLEVTIHVLAASTQREFSEITRGMIPDWGAAVAVPGERLIILALNAPGIALEEIVPHEVSHVLLGVLSQQDRVPRWFDEGLAMRLAGEWTMYNSIRLARGALGGGLIPLRRIDDVLTFHQDQAWLAYAESFAAVTWLEESIGRDELGRLLRSLDSMTFEEALVVNNNIRTSVFESDWLARARRRYAIVGLADDVWIWSIVIPGLFFLALAARWWRNRRTYERWQAEDDDDDDGPDEPLDERILDTY
jgi:hypothetical protein